MLILAFTRCSDYMQEFIIKPPGAQKAFITRPTEVDDGIVMLKHFLLDCGSRATDFAHGNIPEFPPDRVVRAKAKRPQMTSEYVKAMHARQKHDHRLNYERQDILETVLASLTAREEISTRSSKSSVKSSSRTYSPAHLLATFKKSFMSNEPHVNFDYLGFWELCDTLHHKVIQNLTMLGWELSPSSNTFPDHLVYNLLSWCLGSRGEVPTQSDMPLAVVAEILDEALKGTANKYSNDAFSQSSGRIPKHLRPNLKAWDKSQAAISAAGAILNQGPGCRLARAASRQTVYDENGSIERLELAKRLEKELDKYYDDHGLDQWNQALLPGLPWTRT